MQTQKERKRDFKMSLQEFDRLCGFEQGDKASRLSTKRKTNSQLKSLKSQDLDPMEICKLESRFYAKILESKS